MMRDPEYDRFGPWIIEISELDPPPPLFLPYLTREETALLSIKIPRKIERRKAYPGMNMYDYLVTLYEKELVILQRVDADVRSETFAYDDIQFLRQGASLLKGGLHIGVKGNSFDLPFSTISSDIIDRVVDLIRERYDVAVGEMPAVEEVRINKDELSYYFARLLEGEIAQNPQIEFLASQPETVIGSYETNPVRRILFGIARKTMLDSLHLFNGRELKIISRDRNFKFNWQTVHGKDVCYLPINKIKGVSWEVDEQNTAVVDLVLHTAGGDVSYALMRDNPTIQSYARFLSAVSGLAEELAHIGYM